MRGPRCCAAQYSSPGRSCSSVRPSSACRAAAWMKPQDGLAAGPDVPDGTASFRRTPAVCRAMKKTARSGLFRGCGGALQHLGDRLADVVDVLAVEGRNAHAAGVGAIDAELVAQADHLFLGQP